VRSNQLGAFSRRRQNTKGEVGKSIEQSEGSSIRYALGAWRRK